MTFPRRLTPSDKERATIVQQRMTPGSALGVGSRHVRTGQQPPNGPSSSGGGGVIGSAQYVDPGTSTATNYQANPSSLYGTDGDASSIDYDADAPGLLMVDEGWYQAFAYAEITGITSTGTGTIQIHWPNAGAASGIDAWGVLANGGIGGAMTATTVISRNFSAGGLVTVNIYNPGGGTINTVTVQLTRLAGS